MFNRIWSANIINISSTNDTLQLLMCSCFTTSTESVINNTLTELNTENTDNPTSNDASADGLHSHSDTDLLPPSSNSDAAETIHPSHSETDLDKRYVSGTTDHAELPNISVPDDGVVSLASDAGSVQFVNTYAVANGPISPKHTDKGASGDIKKSFNSAFSNFSKGLTSSYSIISEKMKQNMSKHDDDLLGDEWETVSIKSGASSDDDEFAVLKFQNASELPAFECKGWSVSENASVADTASEATDTDPGSTGSTIGGQSAAAAVGSLRYISWVDRVVLAARLGSLHCIAHYTCLQLALFGNNSKLSSRILFVSNLVLLDMFYANMCIVSLHCFFSGQWKC